MDELTDKKLSPEQLRVLGVLIEKELTTPDTYPLSLNALKNGCNQSTNRDPVVHYDDDILQVVLDQLLQEKWIWDSRLGRVAKYAHHVGKRLNLVARENIILALLFLRGPQTVGELRARSGRAYAFSDLNEVQNTLTDLMEWGHVTQLPRQAGRKEPRYGHLFGKDDDQRNSIPVQTASNTHSTTSNTPEQNDKLEKELTQLRTDHETLKQAFEDFKAQF